MDLRSTSAIYTCISIFDPCPTSNPRNSAPNKDEEKMETFHQLAGMTDTRDEIIPEPPPVPHDPDPDSQYDTSRRGSRASLPINRRPSHQSFRSSKRNSRAAPPDNPPEDSPPLPSSHAQSGRERPSHESARTGASASEEDFVWGPSHPCFPHPNPHCAPDSEEAKRTRVIRVRRDWLQAGDLYPQYANVYPEILDPLVTDEDFRFLISNINARLKSTFDPYSARAWLDAALGVATGFVWDDLGLTGSKKGIQGLEAIIDGWNREKQTEGKEVTLVQLRRTGFMALDFVVPDPGVDVVRDEEDGSGIGPAE